MKKWLIPLLIILLIGGGLGTWFYLSWFVEPPTQRKAIYHVPSDAIVIIETDDPFAGWQKVSKEGPVAFLLGHPGLGEYGEMITEYNEQIQSSELLAGYAGSRDMMISLHPVARRGWDFLYIIDLENAAKLAPVRSYIGSVLGQDYEVSRRDYHGQEIMELYDKAERSTIYMSFIDNLLLVSYTHTLVEASIDQMAEPVIGRDIAFVDVSQQVSYDGLLRCYIRYAGIHHLLDESLESDEFISSLQLATHYTGLNMDVEEDNIRLKGFTAMSDTITSYVGALLEAGAGERSIHEVAPDRTTVYLSLGFEDFNDFLKRFEAMVATSPEEAEEYRANMERVERYLKINLKEDFASWVDEEIAILKIRPGEEQKEDEMALIIKATDGETAKEKLAHIARQIKRKTPVKFRSFSYKGYEINYLSIKGFFRLFLGKLFQDLDKPYYTVIDDFVVFSNHPYTLRGIINDHIRETTLGEDPRFVAFNRKFEEESSVFLYANTDNGIRDVKAHLEEDMYAALMKEREYINAFPQIALLMTERSGLAFTDLQFEYRPPASTEGQARKASVTPPVQAPLFTAADSLFLKAEAAAEEEELIVPEEILLDDLNAEQHSETWPNGQVKMEVSLKNGLKHGDYREYDSLGNVIVKGRYRDDFPHGVWKQYDSLGNQVRRIRYKNGKEVN